jgi:hypothetical protein
MADERLLSDQKRDGEQSKIGAKPHTFDLLFQRVAAISAGEYRLHHVPHFAIVLAP